MSSRIGIRQILAPAAAVALIAGGIIARPGDATSTQPTLLERAHQATAAISGLLTPPEEDVNITLEGDFGVPLAATDGGTFVVGAPGAHSMIMLSQQDDDGTYQLTVKNGQMSAKVNGKQVPDDRIVKKGDEVRILDADGNVIATFTVGKSNNAFFGVVGEPRTLVLDELKAVPQVRSFGAAPGQSPPRVMIGITMSDAPDEVLKGIVVDRVLEGLPAGKAGLEAGDVIIGIKGAEDASQESLRGVLRKKSPGDELRVKILRDGTVEERIVKLEKYDGAKLGISVGGAPGELRLEQTPGAYRWFSHENEEQIEKALEKAMGAIKEVDPDLYSEEARKALEQAMKQLESGQWREQFGDMRFNVEIDPEVKWRFFSDEDGNEFVFPKGTGENTFRWETDDRAQDLENRLQRLEEKINKLEKMIEALTDDL